jgi:hypothetical protein
MQAQPGQYGGHGQSGQFGLRPQPVQYGEQGQPGQYGMQHPPGTAGPLRGQPPMPGGYPSPNSHQGPVGFQGPMGHPGPAARPGRMGQQGPGGFAEAGGFAGPVGGPPGNAEGWGGAPDWNAAPGWNNSAPDWQRPGMPAAGPGPGPSGYPGYGYPGADGYRENVNGGDYAYMINEDGAGPARPGRPRGPERRPADESRPRAGARGQASTDSLRAITTGAAGLTRPADPSADTSEAYGRHDPAYGPPGPDWYDNRQAASNSEQAAGEPAGQTETARAETGQAEAAQAEAAQAEVRQAEAAQVPATRPIDLNPHVVRGPFEPLVETAGQASDLDPASADHDTEATRARPWGDGHDGGGTAWGSADDDRDAAPAGTSEYEPSSYEFPGIADDDPAESAEAALDRLRALHLTAAAVAPQSLDAHFDQLLERQRKLISEYLGQTGGPAAPAATSATTAAADDGSLVGFGDDYFSSR